MSSNPFLPLAFLPTDNAVQLANNTYVLVASTGVLIWDILSKVIADYQLVSRSRIRFATIVYFVSRIATLVYMLGWTVLATSPLTTCEGGSHRVITVFFAIGIACSQLLFLLHVRAIYSNNKLAVCIFIFLWLCSAASCTTPLIASFMTPFTHFASTNYCIPPVPPSYSGASVIVPFITDTVFFFALAWRLLDSVYSPPNERPVFRRMNIAVGRYLPRLARALFQNGQAYFLSTIVFNIATLTLLYTPRTPVAYRDIAAFPSMVIINVMAGRFYRNVNYRAFQPESQPHGPSAILSELIFEPPPPQGENLDCENKGSEQSSVLQEGGKSPQRAVSAERIV